MRAAVGSAIVLVVVLLATGAQGQAPASTTSAAQSDPPAPDPSVASEQVQTVTTTGIVCGSDEVSFEAISGPTEGANRAQLNAMDQNYAYLKDAVEECLVRRVPGCEPIHRWLNEPEGERFSGYGRNYVTPLQIIQARRVAAHAKCSRMGVGAFVDHTSCRALVSEELAAMSAAADYPKRTHLLAVITQYEPTRSTGHFVGWASAPTKSTKALLEVIESLSPAKLPDAPSPASAEAILDKLDAARRACAAGNCKDQKHADARDAVEKLALIPWFYEAVGNGLRVSSAVPAAVLAAIDGVRVARPSPAWPPEQSTSAEPESSVPQFPDADLKSGDPAVRVKAPLTAAVSRGTQLQFSTQPGVPYEVSADVQKGGQEFRLTEPYSGVPGTAQVTRWVDLERLRDLFSRRQTDLRKAQSDCVRAKYYVGPSGGFIYQPSELNNELCIDTSSVRTDRPFEVDIAEYPIAGPLAKGIHIPTAAPASYSLSVWAGERTRIPSFHHGIVRFTVRGYPSGVSLRMLALSGSSAAPASLEFSDLFRQQAQLAQQATQAAQAATAAGPVNADAMDALADRLASDTSYSATVKKLTETLTKADAAYGTSNQNGFGDLVHAAWEQLPAVKTAISGVVTKFQALDPHGPTAISAAVALVKLDGPPQDSKNWAELDAIHGQSDKLAGLPAALHQQANDQRSKGPQAPASKTSLTALISRICRISKELIPVVDEDVLLDDDRPGTYVLDYDWDSGFDRTTQRKLMEGDNVFVRVRHVRPGGAVSITFNDKGTVQHSVSIVGAPTAGVGTGAGETLSNSSSPVTGETDPDQPLTQARSTQIMSLGRLEGPHRYDIVLCAQTGGATGCDMPAASSPSSAPATSAPAGAAGTPTAPPASITNPAPKPASSAATQGAVSTDTSKAPAGAAADTKVTAAQAEKPVSRIIARNTLIVHSEGHLGVRMGVGADVAFGDVYDVAQYATTGQYYVRRRDPVGDFALPLLLTWYPWGRDTIEGPPPFSSGVGVGLDVLKIGSTPRLYAAYSFDWYGFGLTIGASLERINSIDAAPGTYLTSASETTPQSLWHFGAFAAGTTDFDIFTTVFRSYFSPTKLPSIGTAANP